LSQTLIYRTQEQIYFVSASKNISMTSRTHTFSASRYNAPENSAFGEGHPNWDYTTTIETDATSGQVIIRNNIRKYLIRPHDDKITTGFVSFSLEIRQAAELAEFLESLPPAMGRRKLELDVGGIQIEGERLDSGEASLLFMGNENMIRVHILTKEYRINPDIVMPYGDIHHGEETVEHTTLDELYSFLSQFEQDIRSDDPFISGTVLLLSALDKERDALDKILSKHPNLDEKSQLYRDIIYTNGSGAKFILWSQGEAGNKQIRRDSEEIISEYQPDIVILYGIAAGIKQRTDIGDVIVTDKVADIRKGASFDDKPREIEIDTIRPDERYQFPTSLNELPSRTSQIPDGIEIHDDLKIASGDNVVKNEELMNRLRDADRKIGAVGMEAAGVIEACNDNNIPFFLAKSVTDFGTDNKDDAHHSDASTISANAVFEGFLKK